MFDKMKNIKKFFVIYGNIFLNVFNVLFFYFFVTFLSVLSYTKNTFGDVSLPQLLFFTIYRDATGVENSLVYDVVFYMFIKPFLLTLVLFFVLKKVFKGKNLFGKQCHLLLLSFLLLLFSWLIFVKFLHFLYVKEFIWLCWIFYGICFINIWRNGTPLNVFIMLACFIPLILYNIISKGSYLISSCLNYGKTNFYEQNYQNVDDFKIKKEERRNVILVFTESFENKFSKYAKNDVYLKVNDEDAVKFSNLEEGYSQNWTQGALFSAFTGVHIHYLSDVFRYKINNFKFFKNNRVLMATNNLGSKFDFYTPNITYLGDVAKYNDYNNIFVQGGALYFSGTDKFLFNHGFDRNNVYEYKDFENTKEYEVVKYWWGVPDYLVFEKFKEKISKIDKNNPFLAVMFTLDLHRGDNPFYPSVEEQSFVTIKNINNFIEWFKKQNFYENTTLIIVADHKRMGQGVQPGGDLYNAFFNLPKRLENKLNINRSFNQIDLFPTILDMRGVNLVDGKAGVGVSLFSKNKTLAEKYSYDEQMKIFSKIDRYYQRLWEHKELFSRQIKPSQMLIAHAGGKIDGNVYTNSLEAIKASVDRGYKYIELDLVATQTPPYKIVGAHDYLLLCKMVGKIDNCNINTIDTKKDMILGKYTLLDDEKILDFFLKHEDLWLVTDKIDNFELLNQKFFKLKNRMIVEVFSLDKYKQAKRFGFAGVAYNVKNYKDAKIVIDNNIAMVTMSLNIAKNDEIIEMLKEKGVKILGYTAKNFAKVKQMQNDIDMFYYDGEENLGEF